MPKRMMSKHDPGYVAKHLVSIGADPGLNDSGGAAALVGVVNHSYFFNSLNGLSGATGAAIGVS